MPMYEYICVEDGEVLELLRPMAAADQPVEDPKGLGRRFVRKMSTFAAQGGGGTSLPVRGGGGNGGGGHVHSGSCGCGKPRGSCGQG